MNTAEREELLRAIDECAAQARHLADVYDMPVIMEAVAMLHAAADLVEAA